MSFQPGDLNSRKGPTKLGAMKHFMLAVILAFGAGAHSWAADPLEKMSREFGRNLESLKNPRVGILSFPYHDGKISSGSSILSERLTTYMAGLRNVRVIERTLLKKVLEEQHLSETGALDAGGAQKVGKVLDVDVLVVGTLNDLEGGQTELNARVLRADTGEVVAAKRVVALRVWPDAPRRNRPAVSPSPALEQNEPTRDSNEPIKLGPAAGRGGYLGGR